MTYNISFVSVIQHNDSVFVYTMKWSPQCLVDICHHTKMENIVSFWWKRLSFTLLATFIYASRCHAVCYIPMIYLFYNWKLVPFDLLHPFCLPTFHPYPWQPPICSLYLWTCFFLLDYTYREDHMCLSLFVWFISLSVTRLRSTHVANCKVSFFFMT